MAAGKSVVARMLNALGVPVWDADAEAKSLYRTDPVLRKALLERWGEKVAVRDESGRDVDVDRRALASRIFADSAELRWLESLVHPAVARAFDVWASRVRDVGEPPYVVREAAILFESGSHKTCDFVVTVEAPEEVRIARAVLRGRGQVSEEEVRARLRRQATPEQRIELADVVLKNGPQDALLPQVLDLHAKLMSLKRWPLGNARD
jgi:dephospho-CoA kinase